MIDTIRLKIDLIDLPPNYHIFLFNVLQDDVFREADFTNGIPKVNGRFKNLKVNLNKRGLVIDGSLTKCIVGDNLKTIYQEDAKFFFEELSKEFNVDFLKSKVIRLDIAGNIFTNFPIKEYTDCLFDLRFFDRCEQQNGLSYINGNRTISFYDKIKELKKKDRLKIDPIFLERNILRYEYRYLKNKPLSTFLKVDKAKLSDIIGNYSILVDEWLDVFKNINKKKDRMLLDIELLKVKGALDKQLIRLGIEAFGGELKFLELLNYGKKRKYFDKYPNKSSNLKTKYKKLIRETSKSELPDLISELNNKVAMFNVYAHPKF